MTENTPNGTKLPNNKAMNEMNSKQIIPNISMQVQNGSSNQSLLESCTDNKEQQDNILSAKRTAMHQPLDNDTEDVTTLVSVDQGPNISAAASGTLDGDNLNNNSNNNECNSVAEHLSASSALSKSMNEINSSNSAENKMGPSPMEEDLIIQEGQIVDNGKPMELLHQEQSSSEGTCMELGMNNNQMQAVENGGTVELPHRVQSIVDYSDDNDADDSSSSSGSSFTPPIEDRLKEVEDELSEEEDGSKKSSSTKPNLQKNKIRTEGEVFPEELPPLEYLMISPDESVELEPLGVVSGIVDVLVVIKADNNSPALYDDTILFVEGRKPLGLIFETFGTVERPYYSVRFNDPSDIAEKGIEVGCRVFFAPKADNLTKYVFIAELRKIKCDDASWKNDNEVPTAFRDYSDDEEERREKRRAKNKERGIPDTDPTERIFTQRKKNRKRPGHDARQADSNPDAPSLLPGELMRNPFGAKPKNQWPSSQLSNHSNPTVPRSGGPLSVPPPPPAPHMFHTPPPRLRPGPAAPSFGQSPQWSPRFNAPRPFHQPPPSGPNHPPSAERPPFSYPPSHSAPPFGRPPFAGSNMPSFSSPGPPPFHQSNELGGPHLNAPSNPHQRPPSYPTQFPPHPPAGVFGLRPARFNFNPSVPPPAPPLFSCTAPPPQRPSFPAGQNLQSNGHQRFPSNSHA